MKIDANSVTFEPQDMAFVKKFGILKATEMALDYHAEHPNLPFLYDAEQLAGFLGISRGELNDIVNHIQKEYKEAHLPKKTVHTAAYASPASGCASVRTQSKKKFFHSFLFLNLQRPIKRGVPHAEMPNRILARNFF